MNTLAKLLEDLGPALLTLCAAPRGLDIQVRDVSIHDPADPPETIPATLVLGVGLSPGAVPAELVGELGRFGAAGLVIKSPGGIEPGGVQTAEAAGIALLTVPSGATWMQVAAHLRSVLMIDPLQRADDVLDGVVAGDLFAMANAVAALVDAPVTIEDPMSRVLAFSHHQAGADPARIATILGRQAPEPNLARMRDRGVYRRLHASEDPIFIKGLPPDVMPRMAVAIRAGDQVIGSIWAAVNEPLPPDKQAAMRDAAKAASLHVLRHRLSADAHQGMNADLVATVLEGGPLAANAARRLGLEGLHGYHVMAVSHQARALDVSAATVLARALGLLALHTGAVRRSVATAMVGNVIYSIVPTVDRAGAATAPLRQLAEGFLQRAEPVLGQRLIVGLGRVATSLDLVPRSRRQADQVLRALRMEPDGPRVGTIDDVGTKVLLLRLEELTHEDRMAEAQPLQNLREYDRAHHTSYLETMAVWLRTWGDNEKAAHRLGIHANTVRLRIKALQELGIIDLADHDQRLGTMLQLRLDELRAAEEGRGDSA